MLVRVESETEVKGGLSHVVVAWDDVSDVVAQFDGFFAQELEVVLLHDGKDDGRLTFQFENFSSFQHSQGWVRKWEVTWNGTGHLKKEDEIWKHG